MDDVKRTLQIVKRTAESLSSAIDQMVGDLPEETSPQRALELVIAELTTLQPWFLELIFEDHLFKEAYEAARAYAGSPRDALGQPNPELIEALGISQYLANLPNTVPAGSVLVHNHVSPQPVLGSDGFRAWLEPPDATRQVVCDCSWAPDLGTHYRVPGPSQL